MADGKEKKPILDMGILAMVVTHALVHAAGNMQSTIYPDIKREFQLNNFQIGVISAVPPLSQAIFSIPTGWISDRFGSKKIIALSMGMAALGAVIAGFSISPWMFVVAAVLFTLTSTFYHPPAHSYTARTSTIRERAKTMGFLNAGGTFGVSLGPLSVSILLSLGLVWKQVYQFWVIPIILGIIFLLSVKTDPKGEHNGNNHDENHEPGEPTSLLTREFLLYIASRGVRMFGMSMFAPFLSIYLSEVRGWSTVQIGLMLGARARLYCHSFRRETLGSTELGSGEHLLYSCILCPGNLLVYGYVSDVQILRDYGDARSSSHHCKAVSP